MNHVIWFINDLSVTHCIWSRKCLPYALHNWSDVTVNLVATQWIISKCDQKDRLVRFRAWRIPISIWFPRCTVWFVTEINTGCGFSRWQAEFIWNPWSTCSIQIGRPLPEYSYRTTKPPYLNRSGKLFKVLSLPTVFRTDCCTKAVLSPVLLIVEPEFNCSLHWTGIWGYPLLVIGICLSLHMR